MVCILSEEEEIEFKYSEPLNTILLIIILICTSASSLYIYFLIKEPSENSILYGLNQFYQLGILFVTLLAFVIFVAKPIIRKILIKPKSKQL
jgi:hypothetical protein